MASTDFFSKCSPLARTGIDNCAGLTLCNLSPTTADEFDEIQTDVSDLIEEPTRLIMTEWLNSYGPVGLTRIAAANGIEEGDCGDCSCNDVMITFKDEGGTVFQTNFVNVGSSVDIPFVPASTGYISVMNVHPGRCLAFTLTGLPYYAPPAHDQKIVDCDNVDHFYVDVDLPSSFDSVSAFVLWSTGFNGVLTMNVTGII